MRYEKCRQRTVYFLIRAICTNCGAIRRM
ncbi:MAG: hypothetical protein ACLU8Q_03170 [Oscillospiraceae bacterium]